MHVRSLYLRKFLGSISVISDLRWLACCSSGPFISWRSRRRGGGLWHEAVFQLSFIYWSWIIITWTRRRRSAHGAGRWHGRLLSLQHEQRWEEKKAVIWASEVAGEKLRAGEQTRAWEENAASQGVGSPAPTSRSLVPKPKSALENQTTGARLRGFVPGLQPTENRVWCSRPGERKTWIRGEC